MQKQIEKEESSRANKSSNLSSFQSLNYNVEKKDISRTLSNDERKNRRVFSITHNAHNKQSTMPTYKLL